MVHIIDLTDGSWGLSVQMTNLLTGVPVTDIQPMDVSNIDDDDLNEIISYIGSGTDVFVVMTDTGGGQYHNTLTMIRNSSLDVKAYIALNI